VFSFRISSPVEISSSVGSQYKRSGEERGYMRIRLFFLSLIALLCCAGPAFLAIVGGIGLLSTFNTKVVLLTAIFSGLAALTFFGLTMSKKKHGTSRDRTREEVCSE
jgi:hypothetical protein